MPEANYDWAAAKKRIFDRLGINENTDPWDSSTWSDKLKSVHASHYEANKQDPDFDEQKDYYEEYLPKNISGGSAATPTPDTGAQGRGNGLNDHFNVGREASSVPLTGETNIPGLKLVMSPDLDQKEVENVFDSKYDSLPETSTPSSEKLNYKVKDITKGHYKGNRSHSYKDNEWDIDARSSETWESSIGISIRVRHIPSKVGASIHIPGKLSNPESAAAAHEMISHIKSGIARDGLEFFNKTMDGHVPSPGDKLYSLDHEGGISSTTFIPNTEDPSDCGHHGIVGMQVNGDMAVLPDRNGEGSYGVGYYSPAGHYFSKDAAVQAARKYGGNTQLKTSETAAAVGTPCKFCGETMNSPYEVATVHAPASNGWCRHASVAFAQNGGNRGNWNGISL